MIAIVWAVRHARKQALCESPLRDRMNFVVCLPLHYRVVGFACAALFGVLSVIALRNFDRGDVDYRIGCVSALTICALGLFFVYKSYRWKIVVAEDRFVLTPLFGKRRNYSVRDVTHIFTDPTFGVRVYAGEKKLFTVNRVSVGSAMFVSYLIEKGVRVPDRINL